VFSPRHCGSFVAPQRGKSGDVQAGYAQDGLSAMLRLARAALQIASSWPRPVRIRKLSALIICNPPACFWDLQLSIRMVAGFAEIAERKEFFGCGGPIRTEFRHFVHSLPK
jgi:hypothetical protein